jgi:metallo-beta-lactamase family protein
LAEDKWIHETVPLPVKREGGPIVKANGHYGRLVQAAEKLLGVVKQNSGLSNKDMAKFADQINSVTGKMGTLGNGNSTNKKENNRYHREFGW